MAELANGYRIVSDEVCYVHSKEMKVAEAISRVTLLVARGEPSSGDVDTGSDEPAVRQFSMEMLLQYMPHNTQRPQRMTLIPGITEPRKQSDMPQLNDRPQNIQLATGTGKNKKRGGGGGKNARGQANKKRGAGPKGSHLLILTLVEVVLIICVFTEPRKTLVVKGNWEAKSTLSPEELAQLAELFKKWTSLLNKLTRDNFQKLTTQMVEIGKQAIQGKRIILFFQIFFPGINVFQISCTHVRLSRCSNLASTRRFSLRKGCD